MNDLKFAFRQLLKNRGFTAVAVFTLALGIGASTAIYSVVNTVILNPVPGPEPDRLLQIAEKPFFAGVSPLVLEALRANQDFFADFAICDGMMLERKTEDFMDEVSGALVSPNFFTLWNVPLKLGRTFAKDEATPLDANYQPENDSVIVLSYSWWKSLFHGDSSVIGRTPLHGHRRDAAPFRIPEWLHAFLGARRRPALGAQHDVRRQHPCVGASQARHY